MAKKKVKITGVEKAIRNLNRKISKLKKVTMSGLIEGAIEIRRHMDLVPPKIPVDIGNLRASFYLVTGTKTKEQKTAIFKTGKGANVSKLNADHSIVVSRAKSKVTGKSIVIMGFSASYALAVEEDTLAKRKRPGSGGKFFKGAVDANKHKIIKIVERRAKKGKL